jgi:hypothetical protein
MKKALLMVAALFSISNTYATEFDGDRGCITVNSYEILPGDSRDIRNRHDFTMLLNGSFSNGGMITISVDDNDKVTAGIVALSSQFLFDSESDAWRTVDLIKSEGPTYIRLAHHEVKSVSKVDRCE